MSFYPPSLEDSPDPVSRASYAARLADAFAAPAGFAALPSGKAGVATGRETLRLSCVVPAYNEAGHLAEFLAALHAALTALTPDVEIIVVNDGSRDATREIAHAHAEALGVRYLELSRNFGKEAALTAGIAHARGNAVLLIDSDFQHPLSLVRAGATFDPPSTVHLAGPVCEAGDVLAYDIGRWLSPGELRMAGPGAILAIGRAGAYGTVMASTYNGRPRPGEVVLEAGQARLSRRRETLEDLVARDV